MLRTIGKNKNEEHLEQSCQTDLSKTLFIRLLLITFFICFIHKYQYQYLPKVIIVQHEVQTQSVTQNVFIICQ